MARDVRRMRIIRIDASSLRILTLRFFLTSFCLCCGSPSSTLSVPGTIEIRDVRISSLTAGRLARLFKDEGDSVRRGDTIAILEQPGLSAMVGQRRAQAEAARHRTADIAAAVADSARAANDVARAQALRDRGIVSPQQFDALTTAAARATARLQATRAALSDARAAREGVASTEALQNDLVLTAPAAGVILTRYLEPGEVAGVGTPIVSIGVVADPWVRAYVGERDLPRIRLGSTVSIHADGIPGTVSGRIVEIAPRAEFTPRAALTDRERADLVFGIKVSFADPAGRLKAGLPVTLDVPLTP
jgi:HlyD family secretion protein